MNNSVTERDREVEGKGKVGRSRHTKGKSNLYLFTYDFRLHEEGQELPHKFNHLNVHCMNQGFVALVHLYKGLELPQYSPVQVQRCLKVVLVVEERQDYLVLPVNIFRASGLLPLVQLKFLQTRHLIIGGVFQDGVHLGSKSRRYGSN